MHTEKVQLPLLKGLLLLQTESRYEHIGEQLTQMRREQLLPYWRFSYALFLLERAKEYDALGRHQEAQEMLDRVEVWKQRHQTHPTIAKAQSQRIQKWNTWGVWEQKRVLATVQRLRNELQARHYLIPIPERQSMTERLKRIESLVEKGLGDEAKADLSQVRSQWIRRQHRSLRARAHQSKPVAGIRLVREDQQPFGPYNSLLGIRETLAVVGERDPIWVEDFIEIYDQLIQSVERLTDTASARPERKAPTRTRPGSGNAPS